ncbi:MAG TPA: hypothetical protein PKD64_00320 [Pirellulaceae bacterium]|nr:hypothetical protein [Pirellulaceae bacterium]HMO90614.1 hypothetical protein [Pirellulaceae bacterium]HMP67807.1 hypothetical protein [Pirellulaceae bacterium]
MHKLVQVIWCATFCTIANERLLADMVWLKNVPQPLSGLIDAEQETTIEFLEFTGGEHLLPRSIPKSEIVRWVSNIDGSKFSLFSSEKPELFLDIAETMLSFSQDAYAQYLARRLYFLGAYWGNDNVRESCLRGLIATADNRDQARRLQALAYQLDPSRNATWLLDVSDQKSHGESNSSILDSLKVDVVQAINFLRGSNYADATSIVKSIKERIRNVDLQSSAEVQALSALLLIFEEVIQQQKASPSQWVLILDFELALLREQKAPLSWNVIIANEPPDFRPLHLEAIIGIDPRSCYFANGIWRRDPIED